MNRVCVKRNHKVTSESISKHLTPIGTCITPERSYYHNFIHKCNGSRLFRWFPFFPTTCTGASRFVQTCWIRSSALFEVSCKLICYLPNVICPLNSVKGSGFPFQCAHSGTGAREAIKKAPAWWKHSVSLKFFFWNSDSPHWPNCFCFDFRVAIPRMYVHSRNVKTPKKKTFTRMHPVPSGGASFCYRQTHHAFWWQVLVWLCGSRGFNLELPHFFNILHFSFEIVFFCVWKFWGLKMLVAKKYLTWSLLSHSLYIFRWKKTPWANSQKEVLGVQRWQVVTRRVCPLRLVPLNSTSPEVQRHTVDDRKSSSFCNSWMRKI